MPDNIIKFPLMNQEQVKFKHPNAHTQKIQKVSKKAVIAAQNVFAAYLDNAYGPYNPDTDLSENRAPDRYLLNLTTAIMLVGESLTVLDPKDRDVLEKLFNAIHTVEALRTSDD